MTVPDADATRSPPAEPSRFPSWVGVAYYTLLGAFAGWCGGGLWTSRNLTVVVASSIIVCSLGFTLVWLWEARRTGDSTFRGFLAVVLPFGVVGGALFGAFNLLPAWLIVRAVKPLEDEVTGALLGGTLGLLFGWGLTWGLAHARRPDPEVQEEPSD